MEGYLGATGWDSEACRKFLLVIGRVSCFNDLGSVQSTRVSRHSENLSGPIRIHQTNSKALAGTCTGLGVKISMAAAQSLPALLQKATLDDHEAILKAANSTLKKSKNDANAQSARLVALLRLDRYEDALRALDEGGDQLKARARLERAYALYKTGYLTEAEKIARDGRDDQGLLHVEAQAAYRLENFEHAAEAYSRLLSASLQNEEAGSDLRINQGAAEAQLTWTKAAPRPAKLRLHRGDLEQFETAFNAACCYIARGEMREAEHTLRLARGTPVIADNSSARAH